MQSNNNQQQAAEGFSVIDAAEKIARARAGLMRSHPMWGTLLMRLKIRESKNPKMRSMVTDGRAVEWSRAFVDALSVEEVGTVLAHETAHCALKHVFRQGDRDRKAYEEACDHVVNLLLTEGGFKFPEGDKHYCDPQFKGMSAEQVYPIVYARQQQEKEEQEQQQEQQKQKQQKGQQSDSQDQQQQKSESSEQQEGGESQEGDSDEGSDSMGQMAKPGSLGDDEGEPSDEQQDEEQDGDSEQDPDADDDDGEQEEESEQQEPGEGEEQQPGDDASEGEPQEGSEQQSQASEQQSGDDQSGEMSEAEQRALEGDWGQAAAAAAQQATQRGHGSAQQQRTFRQSNAQALSFEEYLRFFLARCTDRSEQTWRRQSRRTIASGPYLPGRRGQRIGALVCVIDTSGSIDEKALAKFCLQVASAQADLRPSEIILLAADDEVGAETRFGRGEQFEASKEMLVGGGGTDFRPAFARVLEIRDVEGIEIAGVLYLTDLQGDFPTAEDAEANDYPPTLWCFDSSSCYGVEQKKNLLASVPFGEVAEMQK